MKIELRKVSHSKSLSEETPAYTAQVWVDGSHLCDVSNHGHGGCDNQYPAKGKTHADIAALNQHIKTTFPKQTYTASGEEHSFDTDLELWCHVELGRIDLEKTVKRDLAKKIMFVKPADGKLYSVKFPPNPAQNAQMIAAVKSAHNVKLTLNEMPLADAIKIYETVG